MVRAPITPPRHLPTRHDPDPRRQSHGTLSSPLTSEDDSPASSLIGDGSSEESEEDSEPLQVVPTFSSLDEYIEWYSQQVLHLDQTTGKIRWKVNPAPKTIKRNQQEHMPYLALARRSRPTTPPDQGHRTRHAKTFPTHFRTATQKLFLVRSSLADEGIVGLMYLWKWVKRMIVEPSWQKSVAVSIAPSRPGGMLRWYSIGIAVEADYTTLAIHHQTWRVATAQLLATDLEGCLPFDMRVGQFSILPAPSGSTERPRPEDQEAAITTISEPQSTGLSGASQVTEAPLPVIPSPTSKTVDPETNAPVTKTAVTCPPASTHQNHSSHTGDKMTAPRPLLDATMDVTTPPRSEYFFLTLQESTPSPREDAVPSRIITPTIHDMPPISISDQRYIDPERWLATYYSGPLYTRTSIDKTRSSDPAQDRRNARRRNPTEIRTSLGPPLWIDFIPEAAYPPSDTRTLPPVSTVEAWSGFGPDTRMNGFLPGQRVPVDSSRNSGPREESEGPFGSGRTSRNLAISPFSVHLGRKKKLADEREKSISIQREPGEKRGHQACQSCRIGKRKFGSVIEAEEYDGCFVQNVECPSASIRSTVSRDDEIDPEIKIWLASAQALDDDSLEGSSGDKSPKSKMKYTSSSECLSSPDPSVVPDRHFWRTTVAHDSKIKAKEDHLSERANKLPLGPGRRSILLDVDVGESGTRSRSDIV